MGVRWSLAARWRLWGDGPLAVAASGDGGVTLLESLVAVTLLAVAGTAVLGGLALTHRSGALTEGQSVAENLARNQMEHVFSLPYQEPPSAYPAAPAPPGYGVTAMAEEYVPGSADTERVVVTVSRDGAQVLLLETVRTRR